MPNRAEHRKASRMQLVLTGLAVIVFLAIAGRYSLAIIAFGVGIILGLIIGIYVTPDVDILAEPSSKFSVKYALWLWWSPFTRITHRDRLSHSWPLGTFLRWLYLLIPYLLTLILFLLVILLYVDRRIGPPALWGLILALGVFPGMSLQDIRHLTDDGMRYRIGVWRPRRTPQLPPQWLKGETDG
jgi:uncharacterized metal-binding protein